MPRLSKKEKLLWSFFIDPQTHRRKYYPLCRRCTKNCKQSFRIMSLFCPLYVSKRSKRRKSAISEPFAVSDRGFAVRQKITSYPAENPEKLHPFAT